MGQRLPLSLISVTAGRDVHLAIGKWKRMKRKEIRDDCLRNDRYEQYGESDEVL